VILFNVVRFVFCPPPVFKEGLGVVGFRFYSFLCLNYENQKQPLPPEVLLERKEDYKQKQKPDNTGFYSTL
jgi:hypothetical protein